LHRPRVCQAVEQGLKCKLTLISAPAGYGKTSALVDFAQRTPVPVCWYTADERDRDLRMFVEYLAGAIEEQFPGFEERAQVAIAPLVDDISYDPAAVADGLANEVLGLGTPLVVVIDNYEPLAGVSGIRGFIRRFLEILPSNCHLMVGSRVLPDIPVTHLVAKRQLVGLASHDLRFTPQEIADLLELSQIQVSEAEAHKIAANSEGWITGILLLVDLLRRDVEELLSGSAGATAETYAYLAAEVLERQPPDVQYFLCASSVLREMSVPLCQGVLQIKEPDGLLAELERRNLFITRFGRGTGATFRYHHLFRDFLHQQLRQRDPTGCARLHLRAAAWFDEANDAEETVYHYLAAEAYAEAAALMERVALEWFVRGRVETLLDWAQALPEAVRAQSPRLLLYESKVLTDRSDYSGARRALAHAEAGFDARGEHVADLAEVHNLRAFLELSEGRCENAISEAQTALGMLGQDGVMERANALRYIGKAHIGLGRLDEGIAALEEALALYRRIGSPYNVVNSLQDLGTVLNDLGRFDEAAACLNEALAIARRLGAPAPLAVTLNDLACLHYLRGEYREALALYEEGLAVARRADDLQNQAYIAVGMADLYRDVGSYDRAEPLYDSGLHLAKESEPGLAVYVLIARADMHRWQGDPTQSLALLQEARHLAEERGMSFELQGPLPVAEGIALAESGQIGEGLHMLSEGADFLERSRARRESGRAYFLLAKAHLLAKELPEAVAALHRAVSVAEETGICQFAVVEGRHAPDVLTLGVDEGMALCRYIADRTEILRSYGQRQLRPDAEGGKEAAPYLSIYALGEGQVVRDGHVLSSSDWQAAMAKELFFYILLHGPLERDAIGAVFWPDLTTKKMMNSFHTTLHRARRAVGSEVVIVEDGQYRLGNVSYWFDIEEFESLITRARLLPAHDWQTEDLWRRALALYRGDFLPEVERTWCVSRREALREMYIEALIGMGRCHELRQEFEAAVDWYRRALEADELREDVHRSIMRCYTEAGRRSQALAQYQRCQEILRNELGLEPSLETRQLYAHIAEMGLG
jgi:ATP/maltotriose-dependent transcriptional regulator MalT/DNA-binding SARP family transcriptional activator